MQNKKVKYFFNISGQEKETLFPDVSPRKEEGTGGRMTREKRKKRGAETGKRKTGKDSGSEQKKMAERGGFEPPNGKNPLTVFETAAFDRSAISPDFRKK